MPASGPFIVYPATICLGQKNYQFTINGSGILSSPCNGVVNIPVPGVILTIVSTAGLNSSSVSGQNVNYQIPAGSASPWSITVNIDISGTLLVPGNVFTIVITFPSHCFTPPPVTPVIVQNCSTSPPAGTSGPSVAFFDCSCNKNVIVSMIQTTNQIFQRVAGRLFGNRPKW